MSAPTLFDPHPPDPGNDAAPLAGGAGVNGRNTSPKSRRSIRKPPAHCNAPAGTSEVAARCIADRTPNMRERILAYIVACGPDGSTDDEGEAVLGIKCQTYTPRRRELFLSGLIVDSGTRRNTASGCPATVWVAAEFAPARGAT